MSPFSPTTHGSMGPHSLFSPHTPQSSHPSLSPQFHHGCPLSVFLSCPQFSLSDSHQSVPVTFPVCLLSLTMDVPSQCPPCSLLSQFSLSHLSASTLSPAEMISLMSPSECPLSVTPCSFPSQSHCRRSLSTSPPKLCPHALRAATHKGECSIGADPLSDTSIKPSLTLQTLSALSRQTSPAQNRFRRPELTYFHGFPYWFPT